MFTSKVFTVILFLAFISMNSCIHAAESIAEQAESKIDKDIKESSDKDKNPDDAVTDEDNEDEEEDDEPDCD